MDGKDDRLIYLNDDLRMHGITVDEIFHPGRKVITLAHDIYGDPHVAVVEAGPGWEDRTFFRLMTKTLGHCGQ